MDNVLIFGDSYSTFKGYIPDGYLFYYNPEGLPSPSGTPTTDVKDVTETWWWQLINKLGVKLIRNDSWSGSTIGYTGYGGVDCSKSSSFIHRYRTLKESGFFNKNNIDTVLVFGGTNDSWSDAPLGNMQYSKWRERDLFNVLPAICYFMKTLKHDLPNAKIVFIVNCEIKNEIIDAIITAGEFFGVDTVKLHNIDKNYSHPTVKGMQQICNQILGTIKEKND